MCSGYLVEFCDLTNDYVTCSLTIKVTKYSRIRNSNLKLAEKTETFVRKMERTAKRVTKAECEQTSEKAYLDHLEDLEGLNQSDMITTILKFKESSEEEAQRNVALLVELRHEHSVSDSLVKYSQLIVFENHAHFHDFLVVMKSLPRFPQVQAFQAEFPPNL